MPPNFSVPRHSGAYCKVKARSRSYASPPADFLTGWITVFAWMTVCAQICFLNGQIIVVLIALNDPTYAPAAWHGTLVAWGVLLLPLFLNIYAKWSLKVLEVIGGLVHVVLWVAFLTVLWTLSRRSSAEFVFTGTITDLSGYPPVVSWFLGLLAAAFSIAGFDGVLHMAEEVIDAPRDIPRSMLWSVAINGVLALVMIITILFCIGDATKVSQTPFGLPIVQILLNSTHSVVATTVMMSLIFFIGLVAVFSTLASVSRLTWAFARDKGLPFSTFFEKV
jgi:choline transport protein